MKLMIRLYIATVIAVAIAFSCSSALFLCSSSYAQSDDLNQLAARIATLENAGKYSEAVPLQERYAELIKAQFGENAEFAFALSYLALLLKNAERLPEAEILMRRALAIDERSLGPEHPRVATDLSNLALVLKETYKFTEADPLYARALKLDIKNFGRDDPKVADDLNNMASLLEAEDHPKEAEQVYRSAIAINEKALGLNTPRLIASLNNLAILLLLSDRLPEAETLMKRALVLEEKSFGSDHPTIAIGLNSLAGLQIQQGDWKSALAKYRQASAIIVKQGATITEDRSRIAKKLLANNRFEFRYHIVALDHMKATIPEAGQESFRVAQWAMQNDAAETLYQMSARFADGQGELAKLLREQQDLIKNRAAVDARWIAAIGASDERAAARERASYVQIGAELERLATKLSKFSKYTAVENPQPLDVATTQSLLQQDEALVQILEVPAFYHQPEESFVWVVSKTDFRWFRISLGPDALAELVQALRCGLDYEGSWIDNRCSEILKVNYTPIDSLFDKPLPFDLARAHQLYKSLFGPVEDLIKDKKLVIVASGSLAQLPFQVLVTDPPPKEGLPYSNDNYRDAAWLLRKHAISVLPTVSSLQALRSYARESQAPEEYVGFGNPLLDGDPNNSADIARAELARQKHCEPSSESPTAPDNHARNNRHTVVLTADIRRQPPLPETADELCAVAHDLGANPEQHLYIGTKATEANIKRLSSNDRLSKYKILHFATHGVLAGYFFSQSEPGLILTPPDQASDIDDGYLGASEIAGLKLDADWVILSACNTAAGGVLGGEPLSGLARAFFYAGARSLLVSHWSVNSDAAVKLITRAISQLKADPKIGKAEALRSSMLSLIESGEASDGHPATWAPFALIGEEAN